MTGRIFKSLLYQYQSIVMSTLLKSFKCLTMNFSMSDYCLFFFYCKEHDKPLQILSVLGNEVLKLFKCSVPTSST